MSNIPREAEVDKALRVAVQKTERALEALNRQAGNVMSRGQYELAESMARKGRDIKGFICELKTAQANWRELCRGAESPKKSKVMMTPLWAYYQPILRALESLGGEAKRASLFAEVGKEIAPDLKAGDRDPLSGGKLQRWQVMVLRARKHMVHEGWLESGGGVLWRITSAGRLAAKADTAKTKKAE